MREGVKKKGNLGVALLLAAAASAAFAEDYYDENPLYTREGVELGVQGSAYKYEEPGLMSLTGNREGVVGAGTLRGGNTFLRFEGRGSYGKLKYESNGSGTKSNIPDWLAELRVLVGLDSVWTEASVSPYLGLGYRWLFNDLRGYSSSGAAGYRRYSNYLYAPVGLTARWRMGGGWVLAPTVEYDYFIAGRQITKLSDIDPQLMDATNEQHSGQGYRASLMFEKNNWSFGVWTQYWHIRDSDVTFVGVIGGVPVYGIEPENTTRESGIELRYRF